MSIWVGMSDGERVWDRFLTEQDRQVFALGGYGRRYGFGARPALVIIDVTYLRGR